MRRDWTFFGRVYERYMKGSYRYEIMNDMDRWIGSYVAVLMHESKLSLATS